MTEITWLVDGLAQAAQDGNGQHRVIRALGQLAQCPVQVQRFFQRLLGDRNSERLQHQAQFFESGRAQDPRCTLKQCRQPMFA